ncbi:MAG: DUF3035 domain-containing protein, partial [Alphaproteobacteria bacterium]|nr:DUF3035 domain-containing protein [Alphaproteobacteria bacterium]
ACNDARGVLGLNKNAPDEFKVVARPPLTVPPDFTLRPPLAPGEQAPLSSGVRAQAAETILGRNPESAVSSSGGTAESAFLKKTGVDKADPQIRSRITEENTQYIEQRTTVIDELAGRKKDLKEPVVDASKEKDRLDANIKEGKSVSEGETPEKDPGKDGWFQQLFK